MYRNHWIGLNILIMFKLVKTDGWDQRKRTPAKSTIFSENLWRRWRLWPRQTHTCGHTRGGSSLRQHMLRSILSCWIPVQRFLNTAGGLMLHIFLWSQALLTLHMWKFSQLNVKRTRSQHKSLRQAHSSFSILSETVFRRIKDFRVGGLSKLFLFLANSGSNIYN